MRRDRDMDFEDRPLQRQGQHQAHVDDITLRTADDFQFGMDDPFATVGPSNGIGSDDFGDVDIGVYLEDGPNGHDKSDLGTVDGSVGVGRDAHFERDSLGPELLHRTAYGDEFEALSQRSKSRDPSEQPFDMPMDIDPFPEVDLGAFGIGFDDIPAVEPHEKTPSETRSLSRACEYSLLLIVAPSLKALPASPLTEPPVTPPPQDAMDITTGVEQQATEKPKRRIKDKKQIIDSVTELQNEMSRSNNRGRTGGNANPLNTDTTSITTKQQFLPRSSIVMRLLEIREDPVTYFLSNQSKAHGTVFSAAPPGLTPELAELFARAIPASSLKRKGAPPEDSPSKRSRKDEVEVARRAESAVPSEAQLNFEPYTHDQDAGLEFPDQSGLVDDFQLEIPEVGQDLDGGRARSVVTDRSRQSSIAPGMIDEDGHVMDDSCPVAIFDVGQPSQTQASQAVDQDQAENQENQTGYSKNTIKALGLIRKELQPTEDDEPVKAMSFKKMTTKVRTFVIGKVYLPLTIYDLGIPTSSRFLFLRIACSRYKGLRASGATEALHRH